MIKPYWDSRKELHPINLGKKEFWRLSIDWFPEYRMTKGNAYEETPLPDRLRMPEVLRDSMTTICEKYQINESDFMRRAISEFIQTHSDNKDNVNRFMFI